MGKPKELSTVVGVTKMSSARTVLAFLVAPVFPVLFSLYEYGDIESGNGVSLLIVLIAFPVSYGASLLVGLPMIKILRRKQLLNIVTVTIGGAIFGAIAFYLFGFLFAALLESSRPVAPNTFELLYGAMLGVLVALPFGLIAGYPVTGSVGPNNIED